MKLELASANENLLHVERVLTELALVNLESTMGLQRRIRSKVSTVNKRVARVVGWGGGWGEELMRGGAGGGWWSVVGGWWCDGWMSLAQRTKMAAVGARLTSCPLPPQGSDLTNWTARRLGLSKRLMKFETDGERLE